MSSSAIVSPCRADPLVEPKVASFSSNGGPLFANSVVEGNTFIWNKDDEDEVFAWFSDVSYWQNHEEMRKDLLADSGNWLLERPEFSQWQNSNKSSVLWLHGIPGSGKSKLVARVIDHLRPTVDAEAGVFAYFYCFRGTKDEKRSRPTEVVRSILRQLAFTGGETKVMKEPAAEEYRLKQKDKKAVGAKKVDPMTWDECEQLLALLLQGVQTYIIIDAFDELDAEDRGILYETFDKIAQLENSSVKLFISSRDDGDIKMKLKEYSNVFIKATDNENDIRNFVLKEVDRAVKHRMHCGKVPQNIKDKIVEKLTERANGMFRWVSLQIQALCSPHIKTLPALMQALARNLPKTLEASYDIIYNQMVHPDIDRNIRRIATNAIRWVLHAKRQLRTSELLAAVTIRIKDEDGENDEDVDASFDDFSSNDEDYDIHQDIQEYTLQTDEILAICCNLLVWDESADTFRPTHLSVREYFEKKSGYRASQFRSEAVESCVETITTWAKKSSSSSDDFLTYAAIFWLEHCLELGDDGPDGKLRQKIESFLFENGHPSEAFRKWTEQVRRQIHAGLRIGRVRERKLDDCSKSPIHPLWLASSYGFVWMLEEMFKSIPFDRNMRLEHGDTGMSTAAIWGYKRLIEIFLREGTLVDDPGAEGRTPLLIAAEHGRFNVMRLFISKGADINKTWEAGRTPLHEAIHWGQYESAKILLEAGADLKFLDKSNNSPLIDAIIKDKPFTAGAFYDWEFSRAGNEVSSSAPVYGDIVQLILNDKKLNIRDKANRHALLVAVQCSNGKAVKAIIRDFGTEIDVNLADSTKKQALDYALEIGFTSVISDVIMHGGRPGLKWRTDSYHVQQCRREQWYPKLVETLSQPETTLDAVYIPATVSTETRVVRHDEKYFQETDLDIPYVFIRVPAEMTSVTRVTFATESHDQGFSDYESRFKGTYERSFTWFETDIRSSDPSAASGQHRRHLQTNLNSVWDYTENRIVWDAESPDAEIRQWLECIKPGHIVQVYAKAMFPGWVNYVRKVEIELHGNMENVVDLGPVKRRVSDRILATREKL